MNPYQFQDYRDLIKALLEEKVGRGARTLLSHELNCQPGYISQVLNKSKIHFSPETVLKVSQFLSLQPEEQEYLLILLSFERAGSEDLKKFYLQKIKLMQREHQKVEKQMKFVNMELTEEAKAVYYSHWSYIAIHMLVSLEDFKKVEQMAERLKLSLPFTKKIITFLEDKDLIQKDKSGYTIGKTRIHLKSDSPFIKSHHQNYRHKAIISLEEENDFDLHYSTVMTLSKKDAWKIRDLLLKLLTDKDKILIPSPNEEMICLNFDLIGF